MIPDADCLGFGKETYRAYLVSRLRSTIESCPFLRFKKKPLWSILNTALNF